MSALRAAVFSATVFSSARELRGERRLVGVHRLLLRRLGRFGLLHLGRQLVDFHHPLEHLLLGHAQILLRGLDFVLHGGVFAVGLDGGELVLELGEAALVDGGVLFDGRAAPPGRP